MDDGALAGPGLFDESMDSGLPPSLEPAKGGQHPEVERLRSPKPIRESGGDEPSAPSRPSKKTRFSEPAPASGYIKTRGCPACETGMNAPGIRHSAACRRVNQPVVAAPESCHHAGSCNLRAARNGVEHALSNLRQSTCSARLKRPRSGTDPLPNSQVIQKGMRTFSQNTT